MQGGTIAIKFDSKAVQKMLAGMVKRGENIKPALKVMGSAVVSSVQENFLQEGRPKKWKPLSQKTLSLRRAGAVHILRVKGMAGGLMGSIHYNTEPKRVLISASKDYAEMHQFGNSMLHVPARPYMMIQKEDLEEIKIMLAEYVINGQLPQIKVPEGRIT